MHIIRELPGYDGSIPVKSSKELLNKTKNLSNNEAPLKPADTTIVEPGGVKGFDQGIPVNSTDKK